MTHLIPRTTKLFLLTILIAACAQIEEATKSNQEYTNTEFHSVVNLEKRDFPDSIKTKNLIIMIGDGMGYPQVYAAKIANKGQSNLTSMPVTGISKTNSSDNLITDSAAGATAISTGEKTYNQAIGVDAQGNSLQTILELAQKKELKTGLVATCNLTHATPASFAAHQPRRKMTKEIAHDMAHTAPDLMIGGGRDDFNGTVESVSTMEVMRKNGYTVFSALREIDPKSEGKIAALVADNHLPSYEEGRGKYLETAVTKALENLSNNEDGFFLMIEGSQIDWGGHANSLSYVVTEALDFDRAVGLVLDYAQKDGETLVVITADHKTGGMAIVDGSFENNTVAARFSTSNHTGHFVPVFAYGPDSDAFVGQYENTEIYYKCLKALGWK